MRRVMTAVLTACLCASLAGPFTPAAAGQAPLAPSGITSLGESLDAPSRTTSVSANTAAATAELWDDRFGYPGVGSRVSAVAVDGDVVYVGGSFTSAGGLPIKYIAKWDGRRWHSLGTGVNNYVTALAVDADHNLYVGGDFTSAGGKTVKQLAMWDGAAWQNVGGGISSADGYSAYVYDLLVDGDSLYVGGRFNRAHTTVVNGVARFDTTAQTWNAMNGGVNACCSATAGGDVRALAKSGTTLYVGGSFEGAGGTATGYRSLAAWSGTAWSNVGGGVGSGAYSRGTVHTLAVDGTNLYVGGSFDRTTEDKLIAGLQMWNGTTWSNVGDGWGDGARTTYGPATVYDVAVTGGSVYIGGSFTQVDGAPARYFARYDGEVWQPANDPDGEINAVVPDGNGGVYVGGWYDAVDVPTEITVKNVARYDGTTWHSFGEGIAPTGYPGGYVDAIADGPDGVYVGGTFDQGGAVGASAVARWDGSKWNPLAEGLVDGTYRGEANALLPLGTDVYVAGSFTRAGTRTAANIARWNTTTQSWNNLGTGVAGDVNALTKINGKVIAAGDFTHAGGVAASRIAVWNPATATWSRMPGATSLTFNDSINALTVIANRYIAVGGDFDYVTIGGTDVDANGLLLYDWQTSTWLSTDVAGSGVLVTSSYGASPGTVYGLAASGYDLYVGGDFDAVGDEVSANTMAARSLARLNLETLMWESIGEVGGEASRVRALGFYGSWLGVAGDFATAGGQESPGAAFFDTATEQWTPLGSALGMDDYNGNSGWSIAPAGGTLWVGGRFQTAGGNPSHNIAAWSLPPLASIKTGPSGWTKSTSASFTVSAPVGATKKCWLDGVLKSCGALSFTGLSQGVHQLEVQATNENGAGPIASRVWGVDTVAPTRSTTAPTAPLVASTSTAVKWSGTDAASGVASYDVRYRRAPYTGDFATTYTTAWSATTVLTRNFTTLAPGYTYCFSTRARDVAGNVSGWSTEKCTAAALDDPSLTASTGWTRTAGAPAFYKSTHTQTTTNGARLTRTGVQAKRFAVVATRCPSCGVVEVYVGTSKVATVNLYKATVENQWVSPAYVRTGVSPTSTVSLKVTSTGKTVRIDGLALSRM